MEKSCSQIFYVSICCCSCVLFSSGNMRWEIFAFILASANRAAISCTKLWQTQTHCKLRVVCVICCRAGEWIWRIFLYIFVTSIPNSTHQRYARHLSGREEGHKTHKTQPVDRGLGIIFYWRFTTLSRWAKMCWHILESVGWADKWWVTQSSRLFFSD